LNFASDVTVTLSFAWPNNSGHRALNTWKRLDDGQRGYGRLAFPVAKNALPSRRLL
jgi:hypothetical protein